MHAARSFSGFSQIATFGRSAVGGLEASNGSSASVLRAGGRGMATPNASQSLPPLELYQFVRSHFPYFQSPKNPAFFENAGGSQLPLTVIEAMREHMLDHYVQLGAGYELSDRATSTVDAAHDVIKTLLNAQDCGEVILGGSTSQLLANIADAYRRSGTVRKGDEVIIHGACHEANVGPWVRLAEDVGATVRWWPVNPKTPHASSFKELERLLSERTKIVAVTHVSNILGEILDVRKVVQMVRASAAGARARVVVDGVAYAPHRAMDVRKWGVDWYAFSVYKTWGPHMGALYGSRAAFKELEGFGQNHYWINGSDVPYKFELGGPSHEACAGILGLAQYITAVAKESEQGELSSRGDKRSADGTIERLSLRTGEAERSAPEQSLDGTRIGDHSNGEHSTLAVGKLDGKSKRKLLVRSDVEAFFRTVVRVEQAPQERLLKYLLSKPELTVVGPATWEPELRVPTFSFVHTSKSSQAISRALHKAGFAMRHGHMYARRLLDSIRIRDVDNGVVRISLLHYNTLDEVDKLIRSLDETLE